MKRCAGASKRGGSTGALLPPKREKDGRKSPGRQEGAPLLGGLLCGAGAGRKKSFLVLSEGSDFEKTGLIPCVFHGKRPVRRGSEVI